MIGKLLCLIGLHTYCNPPMVLDDETMLVSCKRCHRVWHIEKEQWTYIGKRFIGVDHENKQEVA